MIIDDPRDLRYIEVLLKRDIRMLTKKRDNIRPGEATTDQMVFEKNAKIAFAENLLERVKALATHGCANCGKQIPMSDRCCSLSCSTRFAGRSK